MLLGGCVCEGLRPMIRSMKYSTVSADGQSGRAQYAASLSPTALWRPCPTSERVHQREGRRGTWEWLTLFPAVRGLEMMRERWVCGRRSTYPTTAQGGQRNTESSSVKHGSFEASPTHP